MFMVNVYKRHMAHTYECMYIYILLHKSTLLVG